MSNEDSFESVVLTALAKELLESGLEVFPIGFVTIVRGAQMNSDGTFDREVALVLTSSDQSPFITVGLLNTALHLTQAVVPMAIGGPELNEEGD